jgi:hypothetical protein
MPFEPTNGPATFINFIHDADNQWKALAKSLSVVINDSTNTKINGDNIFSWASTLGVALLYMECQLRVCQSYQPSLEKVTSSPNALNLLVLMSVWMGIAPPCQSINFSSIGHNLRLSRTLLNSSGLLNSTANSSLILNFKLLPFVNSPQHLNILTLLHPTGQLQPWTLSNVKKVILSDPCLRRFDHRCPIVLRTKFFSHGLGYVVCQPCDDEALTGAMDAY